MRQSGLYGLTTTPNNPETYYVGTPRDTAAIAEFERAARAAVDASGGNAAKVDFGSARLWVYGHGAGAIPYGHIHGDLRAPPLGASTAARRVASG